MTAILSWELLAPEKPATSIHSSHIRTITWEIPQNVIKRWGFTMSLSCTILYLQEKKLIHIIKPINACFMHMKNVMTSQSSRARPRLWFKAALWNLKDQPQKVLLKHLKTWRAVKRIEGLNTVIQEHLLLKAYLMYTHTYIYMKYWHITIRKNWGVLLICKSGEEIKESQFLKYKKLIFSSVSGA